MSKFKPEISKLVARPELAKLLTKPKVIEAIKNPDYLRSHTNVLEYVESEIKLLQDIGKVPTTVAGCGPAEGLNKLKALKATRSNMLATKELYDLVMELDTVVEISNVNVSCDVCNIDTENGGTITLHSGKSFMMCTACTIAQLETLLSSLHVAVKAHGITNTSLLLGDLAKARTAIDTLDKVLNTRFT